MIRKLWIFLASDGWKNTWAFIRKSIIGKFYYQSRTYCLFAEKSDIGSLSDPDWKDYEYRTIRNGDDYSDLMKFGRFCLLPYREWLENGSIACVLFHDGIAVAFSWIHFRTHKIEYVGIFDMGDDIAWIGPMFVHRKHRGHGLQKMMIQRMAEDLPVGIKAVITSVNAANFPSLKSFEKCGFRIGMKVCSNVGMFSSFCRKMEMMNESKEYLRIKV